MKIIQLILSYLFWLWVVLTTPPNPSVAQALLFLTTTGLLVFITILAVYDDEDDRNDPMSKVRF